MKETVKPDVGAQKGEDAVSGKPERSQNFWKTSWTKFKRNRLALYSLYMIGALVFVALVADFLAYNKPIYAVYQGETYFPIINDYLVDLGIYQWDSNLVHKDWDELELESSFWPPVRYLPNQIDILNSQSVGPFEKQDIQSWKFKHFLGTDELGRDVLSGLIHGSRISLTVGLISVGISALIGIFLGACAGYFGDDRIQINRVRMILIIIGGFLGYFYGFFVRTEILSDAIGVNFGLFLFEAFLSILIFAGCITAMSYVGKLFDKSRLLGKKVNVWIDIMVSRIIEIIVSIPRLLLIITIAAIAKPSIYIVMLIIGITSWTGIARFTRGEMLRIRNLEYIQAARSLGFPEWRVIFRHALPNSLAPVFVSIAFGIAAAILIEASLSFLGIGVPPETITWGSLLSEARSSPSSWWLTIFPGLAIFITVTVFNLVGEGLRDALDPRLKR